MRIFILYIILFFRISFVQSQLLYHQDLYYGGITGAGFSTGLGGSGTGVLSLYIEPGSTIRKAFLVCQRFQKPQSAIITVNNVPYVIDSTNEITSYMIFNSGHINESGVHLLDITSNINSSQLNYSVNIPLQNNGFPETFYNNIYLIVMYDNPILNKIGVNIILNNQDLEDNQNKVYQIQSVNPINTNNPVGFAIHSDRVGDTLLLNDGSKVFFNNNFIGLVGGTDAVNNTWSAGGVKGHFYYQNNTLFGLDDDTSDSLMNGSDGLADVSPYLSNGSTSYNFNLKWQDSIANSRYNIYTSFYLSYTTPCDTFTTTATTTQDTICKGESVQLTATGGLTYSWFSAFSTFNDSTLANPIATPSQTTTYIVTIKNDSGCVKTEHVKIWVIQPIDSVTTTPTICGSATGSITAHYNTNANYNFTLYDNNFNLLSNNTTGTFNQLAAGVYIVENNLQNCTFYDTVTVNAVNNVNANFNTSPLISFVNPNEPLGKAPFEVGFVNTSTGANGYLWTISEIASFLAMTGPKDTLIQYSTQNMQHFFTEGGVFEVCLIPYNNQPQCADTVCKTIFIDPNENVSVFIPNVFTPNGDNENDNFVLQITGAELLESLEVEVFNRWGMLVSSSEFDVQSLASEVVIWDGTTTAGKKASEGSYFYVVTYKTKAGETVSEKGTISLLR